MTNKYNFYITEKNLNGNRTGYQYNYSNKIIQLTLNKELTNLVVTR